MIAANVERPSGFEAHGGFELLEPPLAYDAFVGLVRELHGTGAWSPKALARFAWRRWCEVSGQEGRITQHAEPLPTEVRRLFDRATLDAAKAGQFSRKLEEAHRGLLAYRAHLRKGLSRAQACEALGIDLKTLKRWQMRRHMARAQGDL